MSGVFTRVVPVARVPALSRMLFRYGYHHAWTEDHEDGEATMHVPTPCVCLKDEYRDLLCFVGPVFPGPWRYIDDEHGEIELKDPGPAPPVDRLPSYERREPTEGEI